MRETISFRLAGGGRKTLRVKHEGRETGSKRPRSGEAETTWSVVYSRRARHTGPLRSRVAYMTARIKSRGAACADRI